MTWDWTQLATEDAIAFLNAVRDDEDAIIFEPSLCDVYRLELPFYDGYDLVRIVNKYSPPFILLDYLSNGENHFYLDGSDFALQTICARGSTSLDTENILTYIDFYFSYVYERGNTVVFMRDLDEDRVEVKWQDDVGAFVIHTPLIYQDEQRNAVIHVYQNGHIQISSPATVNFLENPQSFEHIGLIHPRAESILEQCRTLLSETEAGKQLLKLGDDRGIEIRVIGSPNIQAFATNKPVIYLLMPAAQYTADYHQALVLAGALYDAGQILDSLPRPSLSEKEELYFAINHHKNLKLLSEICKLVMEYEDKNIDDAVDAMRRLGIEDVYIGIKNEAAPQRLHDIYIDSLIKQGYLLDE